MASDERQPREDPTRSHVVMLPRDPGASRVVVVWEGGSITRSLPEEGRLLIGRALDCELSIDHVSVSRRHAALHVGPVIRVEDLGSSNGTFVGGQRLAAHASRPIEPGDSVEVGAALVLVQVAGRCGAPSTGVQTARHHDLDQVLTTLAKSQVDVLLVGETGVGKEVAADAIHERSARRGRPLTKINCAALPDTMLEAELFGYERGAFTGAVQSKPGILEASDGGTVLLDELLEMPLATQAKLLRVIENREVLRLGALKAKKIDVRFVAATNRDVESEVAAGRFRADLYYRLAGVVLRLAPLRERVAEIRELAARFARETCEHEGRPPLPLEEPAFAKLERHAYPGNVRELKRIIERAVVFARGASLGADDIVLDGAATSQRPAAQTEAPDLEQRIAAERRQRIERALVEAEGNQTRAAELLGVSRRTLLTWLDALALPRPRKRPR